MDIFIRLLELSREGLYCAQIMLRLMLEAEGKEDPDLIRAMGGLTGGVGYSEELCGALTGGMCCISYFAGKGEADELEHEDYKEMMREYSEWFRAYTAEYGGCTCRAILSGDQANRVERCPMVVSAAVEKVMEILGAHGAI